MRVDGTLDIECATWDRYAIGATYGSDGTIAAHRTPAELVDWLLASGGHWWAHCGGVYDFLLIAEELRRRGLRTGVDLSQGRISRMVCGSLVLRDSYPLIPLQLSDAAEMAGVSHSDGPGLRCKCGDQCGGYCAIRALDRRATVREKCENDARALYRILHWLSLYAVDNNISLRGTIGSTAWETARARLSLPDAAFTGPEHRAIREGLYGGRVLVGRVEAPAGVHYDINGAYPAALRAPLPVGELAWVGAGGAARAYDLCRPGIYWASVTVPECHVPPLPVRLDNRVWYPTGSFSGAWTGIELAAAQEHGTRIDAFSRAAVWDSEDVVFASLIDEWYSLRAKAGKYTPLGAWLRLLSNALPGKLAERPDRRGVVMHPEKVRVCKLTYPCSIGHCACAAHEQIDLWGQIWSYGFYRLPKSGHTHWAAYLLSRNRVTWTEAAVPCGDSIVYADTDSLWLTLTSSSWPREGVDVGEWSLKHGFREWHCVGPRAYRYTHPDNGSVIRTAGISITDADWSAGKVVSNRGVRTFLDAARGAGGLFRRAERQWRLPKIRDGRVGDRWLRSDMDSTYPFAYEAIRGGQASARASQ